MTANLFVSTVSMALGLFVAVSPHKASEIWGSQRLRNLSSEQRASFARWYRAFGILLWLVGLLCAVDEVLFSSYTR
jgi:hypothetical protein